MSNFLTRGRLALLAALKENPELAERVRSWHEFGPGLLRASSFRPAACPALSVAPAHVAHVPVANVQREVRQVLRIGLATRGQDAEPCEHLVALVLDAVEAGNADCLGLADEGLAALRVRSATWSSASDGSAAPAMWTADVLVELLWRRT